MTCGNYCGSAIDSTEQTFHSSVCGML